MSGSVKSSSGSSQFSWEIVNRVRESKNPDARPSCSGDSVDPGGEQFVGNQEDTQNSSVGGSEPGRGRRFSMNTTSSVCDPLLFHGIADADNNEDGRGNPSLGPGSISPRGSQGQREKNNSISHRVSQLIKGILLDLKAVSIRGKRILQGIGRELRAIPLKSPISVKVEVRCLPTEEVGFLDVLCSLVFFSVTCFFRFVEKLIRGKEFFV